MVSIFLLGYRGGWTPLRRNRITARRCAYVLADNKLALNAGRDLEMLSLEIGDGSSEACGIVDYCSVSQGDHNTNSSEGCGIVRSVPLPEAITVAI